MLKALYIYTCLSHTLSNSHPAEYNAQTTTPDYMIRLLQTWLPFYSFKVE
jgi:hypothetical protein